MKTQWTNDKWLINFEHSNNVQFYTIYIGHHIMIYYNSEKSDMLKMNYMRMSSEMNGGLVEFLGLKSIGLN